MINLKYRAIDFDSLNYSTSVYSIILKMITTKTRYQELLRVYEKEMTMKVMDRSVAYNITT